MGKKGSPPVRGRNSRNLVSYPTMNSARALQRPALLAFSLQWIPYRMLLEQTVAVSFYGPVNLVSLEGSARACKVPAAGRVK